jgi:hypothetical protein
LCFNNVCRCTGYCCLLLLLQPVEPQADPQAIEDRHLLERKKQLLDPENGTLKK